MPWHPSLQVDVFEMICSRRIKFLTSFAGQASKLITAADADETGQGPPNEFRVVVPLAADPRLMAEVAARTEAAELAFLGNRTALAIEQIGLIVEKLSDQSPELWPTMRLSLLGAINREVDTRLTSDGILLSRGEFHRKTSWTADGTTADHTASALFCSAIASGSIADTLQLLAFRGDLRDEYVLGFIALMKTPEADVLPLFGFRQDDDGRIGKISDGDQRQIELGWIAAVALVQNYAARVRAIRSDKIRWSQLRPRAPLLDWSLLILFLGIRRRLGREWLDGLVQRCGPEGLVLKLAAYLRDLADEIDGWSDRDRGGRPSPLDPYRPSSYVTHQEYQTMRTAAR